MGETNYNITTARFRLAGRKNYPKSRGPYIGRNPTGRRGTACAHCAPAFRPSPRNTRTSRPAARFPRETARNSRSHSAACPQPLLVIITPATITIAVTTAAIIAVIIVIAILNGRKRVFEGQMMKRDRRTGEPVPCHIPRSTGQQPEGNSLLTSSRHCPPAEKPGRVAVIHFARV